MTGGNAVGVLVGLNGGLVTGSFAAGSVAGEEAVGGLVGANHGVIAGSHATAHVVGETWVGGLVGFNDGRLTTGYATGRVSGALRVGGLVGYNRGSVTAAYSTGPVSGADEAGGLIGATEAGGAVVAGYWDTTTSGLSSGGGGHGVPTSALQSPTGYAGLYEAWNVDGDGDGEADAVWDFGTTGQYPALSMDADGDGQATWEEVGHQLRAGPVLTGVPTTSPAGVDLRWTEVDPNRWSPAPEVTYTVLRAGGGAVSATVAQGVHGGRYTDAGTQLGAAYTYQVAAAVGGGEAARSALLDVRVPCAFTVTPVHEDVLWTRGSRQVVVSTGSSCSWTAASESDFLAVTAGTAGTGSGTVTYTVAANAGGPRRGSLSVAGQRVTMFQASPTVFTDHPLQRGVTAVKAIHFRELRARTDRLRATAGLAAFGWTDPVLTPGVTPVRLVHLTELRAALAETFVAFGRLAPAYEDAETAAGATVIEAAHLMQLRAALTDLERGGRMTTEHK